MLTDKPGDEGSPDIQRWANQIATAADEDVGIEAYYDADSSTYVLRLMRPGRVLIFRLSEAQVRTTGREEECARTLKRKIQDLKKLI